MLLTDPRWRRGKSIAMDISKFFGGIVRVPLVRGKVLGIVKHRNCNLPSKEGSNNGESILLGNCSGLSPEHRVSVIICYENER